jgi:penicillin-binding protein 2
MRLKLIVYFIIIVAVLLLSRVYFLSIKSNIYYQQLSEQNYIKDIALVPTRGTIKDRNGIPLAINKLGFNISIVPHLRSKKNKLRLKELVKIIIKHFPNFDEKKLIKRYYKNDSPYKHDPVVVVPYIEYNNFYSKYPIFNNIDGFTINSVDKRHYPYGSIGAHIIGYTGKASRLDVNKNSISKYTGIIGKNGLEQYYNQKLQGQLGYKKVKVNALNKIVEVIEENQPLENNDITTTIDINLQQYIHELFTKNKKGVVNQRAGAVVVMDINNGEILAAGSFPEYDSNIFVNGISQKDWSKIINDFNHPFTNKITKGLYPPGSVIKMGVALAFLKNGLSNKFHVFCNGETTIGNRKFRCWKKQGHATVHFRKAIRESCDDFFYKGSLKIGIDNIHDTLMEFGFGEKTNIDQPHEFVGINPSKHWKRIKYKTSWFMGETANSSIGQGFILVTPMQVARYTGGLASNRLQTPHFLLDNNLIHSHELHIDKNDLRLVQQGMYDVANHPKGTASRYIKTSIKVAAKTGTAQVVGIPQSEKKRMKEYQLEYFKRSHAWLTTYAPYKNPQYVVTVLVEHGGHGGSAAGAIVGKIYNKLIELNYIKN